MAYGQWEVDVTLRLAGTIKRWFLRTSGYSRGLSTPAETISVPMSNRLVGWTRKMSISWISGISAGCSDARRAAASQPLGGLACKTSQSMKTFVAQTPNQWRKWLVEHHN